MFLPVTVRYKQLALSVLGAQVAERPEGGDRVEPVADAGVEVGKPGLRVLALALVLTPVGAVQPAGRSGSGSTGPTFRDNPVGGRSDPPTITTNRKDNPCGR